MARTPSKKRNDSVDGKLALVEAANTSIQPINEVSELALFYFSQYSSTRPSFSWSRGDIVRLTKLSERMAEVDRISELIKQEGPVVINQRGTQIPNPLLAARDSLERTCMATERSLSVYAPMEGSNKKNTFDQAKEVEKIQKSGDDDLLA